MKNENISEYNENIYKLCESIMFNVTSMIKDVAVEFKGEFYKIICVTSDSKFYLEIKINNEEFHYRLSNNGGMFYINVTMSNMVAIDNFETGDFSIKIKEELFLKYEEWLKAKNLEFLSNKIKCLEKSTYEKFNIGTKIKRTKINNIINKKED